MAECPYHSVRWRSVTQCMINVLRDGSLLKGNHIRLFPRLVCACPGKEFVLDTEAVDILLTWSKSLKSKPKLLKLCIPVQNILKAVMRDDALDEVKKPLLRLLSLIYLICSGNTSFLEHDSQNSISTVTSNTENQPEPCEEETFYLDLPVTPTTYIGTFIGAGGKHLKALCAEYNIISVHLGEDLPKGSKRMRGRRFIYTSPVRIHYKFNPGDETASGFKKALEDRIKLISAKREKHHQNVQRYHTVVTNRAIEWRKRKEVNQRLIDPKEASVGKYFKNKQREKKLKPPPILSESKCLHCLLPHSTKIQECKYHPGYTAEAKSKKGRLIKKWTCCNEYYRQYSTPLEEHQRTGCTVGLHIWRPHKMNKGRRKLSTGEDQIEDITV